VNAIVSAAVFLLLITALPRTVLGESSHGAGSEQSEISRALRLLNQQPKTQSNIAESKEILTPLAKGDDEEGCVAKYLLARIADLHEEPSDPRLAIRLYDELIGARPEHQLAQKAVVKRLMLSLYQGTSDPRYLLEQAEKWSSRLTDAGALRDYHLVMGRSLSFFEGDMSRARSHFEAAAAIGLNDPINRANVLVTIAELFREAGQPELARPYYEKFLADYSRDQRQRIVQERLKEMAAKQP
jgi:tetratricopeptide (TPR) repeat protein